MFGICLERFLFSLSKSIKRLYRRITAFLSGFIRMDIANFSQAARNMPVKV